MKTLLYSISIIASFHSFSQVLDPEEYVLEMEPMTITNTPGIHSFSWGIDDEGRWLIVGGRIDGLHQRQPFAAFLEADNNKFAFVIDPISQESWAADLNVLPSSIYEQLQSTNQEFFQRDSTLYIFGGYGYSATALDHITYPYVTAIDINSLCDAIVDGNPISTYFRQLEDEKFKVTGGQIGYLDSVFYLVGGQLFDGRYNPMGPDHGPGFTQEYTNEIRKFKLVDNGVSLTVTDYSEVNDSLNLHRRDYNMLPQIFPNGEHGFTVFTGVFDPNDLPFLNTVDVFENSYSVNPSFNQLLSQYHSAKFSVYDSISSVNQSIFFGGMSQFYYENGILIEDVEVPFVKTVSKVNRYNDGSMEEIVLDYLEMPALLGAGAEFIPTGDYWIDNEILDIRSVPASKTLVGYIYGGIESSAKNIFFINDGNQSSASNTIFKVFINKSLVGLQEEVIEGLPIENLKVYPNPAKKDIKLEFVVPVSAEVNYKIIGLKGELVKNDSLGMLENGFYTTEIDVSDFDSGKYIIQLFNGQYWVHYNFVKK